MKLACILAGVLLLATPLVSQTPKLSDPVIHEGDLHWFQLAETAAQVRDALGEPHIAAEFGDDFLAWQYQIGVSDSHEFSHYLVFRKSTGRLISVTRNYEEAREVDAFFPPDQTHTYDWPDAGPRQYSVRARRLSGGRVLIAMGVAKPGDKTTQLMLIEESELRFFHSWLEGKLPR